MRRAPKCAQNNNRILTFTSFLHTNQESLKRHKISHLTHRSHVLCKNDGTHPAPAGLGIPPQARCDIWQSSPQDEADVIQTRQLPSSSCPAPREECGKCNTNTQMTYNYKFMGLNLLRQ